MKLKEVIKMDRDVIIAIGLSVIALILGSLSNQMLMGIFSVLLIAAAEVSYKIYLRLKKKE